MIHLGSNSYETHVLNVCQDGTPLSWLRHWIPGLWRQRWLPILKDLEVSPIHAIPLMFSTTKHWVLFNLDVLHPLLGMLLKGQGVKLLVSLFGTQACGNHRGCKVLLIEGYLLARIVVVVMVWLVNWLLYTYIYIHDAPRNMCCFLNCWVPSYHVLIIFVWKCVT